MFVRWVCFRGFYFTYSWYQRKTQPLLPPISWPPSLISLFQLCHYLQSFVSCQTPHFHLNHWSCMKTQDPERSGCFYVKAKRIILSLFLSLNQIDYRVFDSSQTQNDSIGMLFYWLPFNNRAYISIDGRFHEHLNKIKRRKEMLKCCLQIVCRYVTLDFI